MLQIEGLNYYNPNELKEEYSKKGDYNEVKMDITKQQLKTYRDYVNNDITYAQCSYESAIANTGLNKETIKYIMKNYTELNKQLMGITIK